MYAGFCNAKGNYVAVIDGDLQGMELCHDVSKNTVERIPARNT